MTPQEIFDKAYLGMIAQGQPARDINMTCLYRTNTGLSCGVGLLIDNELAQLFDSTPPGTDSSIRAVIEHYPDDIPDWMEPNQILLEKIQDCHDLQAETNEEWVARMTSAMRSVAKVRHLVVPDVLG